MVASVYNSSSFLALTRSSHLRNAESYVVKQGEGVRSALGYVVSNEQGVSYAPMFLITVTPSSIIDQKMRVVARNDCHAAGLKNYCVLQTRYPPYETLSVFYPFMEQRFPTSISYGSTGGPGFSTSIHQSTDGSEVATAEWDRIRARYTVEFENVPYDDLEEVEQFFYGMRGRAIGFRFKDWNDYQIVKQNVLVGDGYTTKFQLFKRYRSGPAYFDRMIRKPIVETLPEMYLDGELLYRNRQFYLNPSDGVLTFITPPPPGAVGYIPYLEFDVPVRFDTDSLQVSPVEHNQYTIKSLNLIEILV